MQPSSPPGLDGGEGAKMESHKPCAAPFLSLPFIFLSLYASPPCSTSYRTGNTHVSLWSEDFSNVIFKEQRLWQVIRELCHGCEMNGDPKIATATEEFF